MTRLQRAIAFCFASMLISSTAYARATFHDLDVEEARQSELGKNKLLDVPFFMQGQKHGSVATDLGTFTSNRRTNALFKSDEQACTTAFLSAIIVLQQRAQKLGGDAVIDIKSITRHNDLESADKFRCVAGTSNANVALTGRIVKFAK